MTMKLNRQCAVVAALSTIAMLNCVWRGSLLLNLLSIIVFLYVLIKFDIEYNLCALLFFIPWEQFSVLPYLSYLTVMELMMAIKLLLWVGKNKIKITLIDFVTLCVLLFYGYFSYRVTGKVTLFRMSIIVFCSIYLKQSLSNKSEAEREKTWRLFFFFIFLTSLFCTFYGYISILIGTANFNSRMGLFRLGSSVGVDRGCLYFCAGLIYPLFYIKKNDWLRILLLAFFVISLLLSVSMTALLTFISFVIIYFYFELKESRRKRNILITIGIITLVLTVIWNWGSGIGVIDNMVNRVKNTLYYLEIGDYSSATTTRTDILEEYRGSLNSMSLKQRLFGTGYTSIYNTGLFSHYSHNTFLDMYICFGIVPIVLLFIRKVKSVFQNKELCESSFMKLVLINVVFLLPCFSVSMLSQGYWFYVFLLI